MVVNDLVTSMSAQGLPASGSVGSGAWALGDGVGGDIVVEAGAVARLLVTDVEGARDINIDMERGSHLNILHVVSHHSATNLAVALAEGCECRMTQIVVSPSDTRVVASLMERGARFEMGGVFVLTDDDQTSITADVNHIASDCTSRTCVKGVASGKSHGSFSGLVYVAPDAQRTDSEQSSRNVTIGEAHIETLPQLEIYADDVKCSHGATVGQMDSEAILYMRQRGLSTVQAKRLQIEGFVQDVAMHSAIESLAEQLMELINTKLNSL